MSPDTKIVPVKPPEILAKYGAQTGVMVTEDDPKKDLADFERALETFDLAVREGRIQKDKHKHGGFVVVPKA